MGDVSNSEGRTFLIVSHNIAAIRQLCTKGVLLNNGKIESKGEIESVLDAYVKSGNSDVQSYVVDDDVTKPIQILKAEIVDEAGVVSSEFSFQDPIHVRFVIKNL